MTRDDGAVVIGVDGEIRPDDGPKFRRIATRYDHALVYLDSLGGSLDAGLEIGRVIRLSGFDVLAHDCASACALAWLGGRKKVIASSGHVAFHAAFRENNGETQVSSDGNALVGAYLSQLGYSEDVILFVTTPQPDKLNFINPYLAEKLGIEVSFLREAPATARPAPAPTPTPMPMPMPAPVVSTDEQTWNADVRSYMSTEGADLVGSRALLARFDRAVRAVTGNPANANLSNLEKLRLARRNFDLERFAGRPRPPVPLPDGFMATRHR